jgi:GpV Apex motif
LSDHKEASVPVNPFREAGLPAQMSDAGGPHMRFNQELAFVRAVYPEIMCADIQPQSGGMIYRAQIADHVVPDVHIDGERPSYVEFWHRGGQMQDVWCRRVHWRRFVGPETAGEPEKRYYHKHLKIERHGDLTLRITPDNRVYLYDAESGDYCLYEQETRTFHVIGPHVFLGTDEADRIELHTGDPLTNEVRIVIPKALIGQTAVEDTDGITYKAGQIIHLVSDLIKLTAETIVLDPVSIKLGHANATERAMLGDLFKAFYNAFVALYNGHQHTSVQTGSGTSGPPSVATPVMDDALLSDVTRISKTGL